VASWARASARRRMRGESTRASGTKRARRASARGSASASVDSESSARGDGGFGAFDVEVADGEADGGGGRGDGRARGDGGSENSTSDRSFEEQEERRGRKRDLYDVLGVAFDATEGQIRNAYLRLALRNHPDKHGGTDEAKARFQEIGEAYFVLSDPDRRAVYDDSAEFDVNDYGVEEYLLRFRTFVLTTQGLSIGSVSGEDDLEVQEEIARFLGFTS